MLKISCWIDFCCPYSYIGFNRLNNAICELGYDDVKWDVHAFELDVDAPLDSTSTTLERYINKYNFSHDNAVAEIAKLEKLAYDDGLVMNYGTARFTNSRNAHRLIKLAFESNSQDVIKSVCDLLFEAYFIENSELSDRDVLVDVGLKSGLDEEEIKSMLDSDKFKSEVVLDERIAEDNGIRGTPYFVFNNRHAIGGVLPVSEFVNVLRKVKFEEDMADKINQ